MTLPVRIGSRQSPLAKIQVQEILSLLEKQGTPLKYEWVTLTTQGDLDKKTSLTSNPADNFFTNTLDRALLNNQIDIAIHSAKDLPQKLPEGLKIYALTKGTDDTDSWVSPYSLEDFPPQAKIGTSSVLRGAMIKALKPGALLVDIRGTIEERLELLDKKQIDGLIVATCALKRLGLEKYIKSILPWEGTPLQGQLAIVGRIKNYEIEKIFEPLDVRRTYGEVFLIGAGPGDPELITLKAIKILKEADCVIYDYLVDSSLLKYAPKAEYIYAGKRKGNHTFSQEHISRLLKEKAMQGKRTIRLKGGDPLIFGRGPDEISYLRSYHIPVYIVPGISSATGVPSSLGIPLTARDVSSTVAFVSAHLGKEQEASEEISIPQTDTIVFLMGLTKLGQIVQALLKAGWPKIKPMAVISQGTKPHQKIIQGTLANIEQLVSANSLEAPALIIAGDIVNYYRKEVQKVFLHCGTNPERYTHLGQIIPWPMIQIQPVSFQENERQQLLKDFEECHFVVLTSPNAVDHFMKTILKLKPVQDIIEKVFIVIGRATAEALDTFGVTAQVVSSQETAEGLFELLVRIMNLEGKKVLLPRSSLPNPYLKNALEKKGATVKEWTIYNNIKVAKRPLPDVPIDGIIFTSPSTVKNFLDDYDIISPSWQILAKGPVTARALQEAGYQSSVVGI
jgi:uroporphyrinogen III methyltransferase/synthase